MCLAINKPKGVQIKKKYLLRGFMNNPHGAGFAIARNNKVEVFKGFWTFADFWEAYEPLQTHAAIIHFRWSTHGSINDENCHPFSILAGGMAIIHNGVISIPREEDLTRSDTYHFVTNVMAPILEQVDMDSTALTYLVEEAIGRGNKLVVLRWDGASKIFNESVGHWHNASWFSNKSYEEFKTRPTTSYGRYPERSNVIALPGGNLFDQMIDKDDAEVEEVTETIPGDDDWEEYEQWMKLNQEASKTTDVPDEFARAWKEYLDLARSAEDAEPFCGG